MVRVKNYEIMLNLSNYAEKTVEFLYPNSVYL